MKKIITIAVAVLLIVALSVSFVACNNDTEQLLFGKELLKLTAQIDVLRDLNNGSADIGVMDSIMANYYMTTGNYAEDLQLIDGLVLAEEEYGIAAKKGNKALMSKINEAIIALATNGELTTIAEEFGLESELLVDSATTNPLASSTDGSWDAIKNRKELIIGYTVFAPIAYTDTDDNFTGFDVELAKAVVAYLNETYSTNIEIEWLKIAWDQKEIMLENGSINLVWNGMSISDKRKESMEVGIPYLANKQAAVIRKADAAKYSDFGAFLKNALSAVVAVERGSAGAECMIIKK